MNTAELSEPTMPSLTGPAIRFKPVTDLMPYARNSRTHSAAQIQQLQASIIEFGWTMPVLEDEQGVVAGHARLAAAKGLYEEFGLVLEFPDGSVIPSGMVPVLSCEGWSDAKRRAYVIADNKLAMNAGWDDEMLATEIQELLTAVDFDMALLGFNDSDLMFLTGAGGDFKPGSAADQGALDRVTPITCPACGHEFVRT